MKPVSAFDNYPPFATNGARTMNTESAKYSVGFVPADTFPAEWANYLFHGATKGVSDLNTAVSSVWGEAQCVITCAGMTPDSCCGNQLATAIMTLINNAVLSANETAIAAAKLAAHPVGSLYWSSDPTDPSQLFGGTWTAVKDKFVWAKGDSDSVNATGGEKSHTLTVAEMPSHNHTINNGNTSYSGSNTTAGFRGINVTSGGMSENATGYVTDILNGFYSSGGGSGNLRIAPNVGKARIDDGSSNSWGTIISNVAHTHNVTAAGYLYGTTDKNGSGASHNNMPPYIVKYCWERIA